MRNDPIMLKQLSAAQAVTDFVAANGRPQVVSLEEDTHIFHFEADGCWEEGDVLLVNKNGHHFRCIRQVDHSWLYANTWNGLCETTDWQTKAGLKRPDPKEVIAMAGTGPQGKQTWEALSLLPKEATTGRRRSVWRRWMFETSFNRESDTFTLVADLGDRSRRNTFTGKLWESREAAAWCAASYADALVPLAFTSKPAFKVHKSEEEILAEIEEHPLWGAF